jgi:hypothetical protein
MNKYPLIGVSILAVVLLVLGSLSNVVGYQSIQSSGMNDSPLFSVRTKRAINQVGQTIVTSDYLGKGKTFNIKFPTQQSKTLLLQQLIERIRTMTDNEFNKFISQTVSELSKNKNNKNIDSIQVLSLLKQIRSPTKILRINQINNYDDKKQQPTNHYECQSVFNNWHPGCILEWVIFLLIELIFPSILIC